MDQTVKLQQVLKDYGIRATVDTVRPGPVVTLYEAMLAPGVKHSRIVGLSSDIARAMAATSCRVSVVSGRNAVGFELPNATREVVSLSKVLADANKGNQMALPIALGESIGGESTVVDLAKMPHLLIAGTTGSGKSVGVNAMIISMLSRMTPEQVRFIMIDPKMLELSVYNGIPHLLTPVVTDPHKAIRALNWTLEEMERRYKLMAQAGVRNISGFNEKVLEGKSLTKVTQIGRDDRGRPMFEEETIQLEHLPYIVVVIDEVADLMMVAGKDVEAAVQRLAQMARAAGIHLIMATQRPSVDVITGTIKANFPTRLSYQVASKIDSRTILGEQGAEQLLGQGDLLYMKDGRMVRLHGPFVPDQVVERIVEQLRLHGGRFGVKTDPKLAAMMEV